MRKAYSILCRNRFGKMRKRMEKTKVIIDCDPGIDDSLAIMLA